MEESHTGKSKSLSNSESQSHDSASIGTKQVHTRKEQEDSEYQSNKNAQSEKEWDPDEQSKISKSYMAFDRFQSRKSTQKLSPYPKRAAGYKRPLMDESQRGNGQYIARQYKLQRTSRHSVYIRGQLLIQKSTKQILLEFWKKSIFNRNNKYKLVYNYIYTAFTLIQCYFISVHITFGMPLLDIISKPALLVSIIFNILDILVSVNTDILIKGKEIRDRLTLFKEFVKRNSFVDIFPLILFLVYYSVNYNIKYRYILLPFLIRMKKFNSLAKHFEESSSLDVKQYNVVQLIKLFFYMIFVAHIVTCVWVYEAKSMFPEYNWMKFFNITEYDWEEQYMRGYYFIIVTMTTIGYGDIYPVNIFEIVMSVFTMIFATGIFGYSINQIGIIFSQIQEYMERKKINSQLQYRIREYLDNFWREEMLIKTENEVAIVNMLNNSLKNELFKETYFVTFQNSIFYEHFSSEVLTQCISYIKEMQCIPEQVIFSKGDSYDNSIYFVESGNVDLYIPDNKSKTILQTLKSGECFGTYSFFTNQERTCYAQSNGFSTILKISRDDFIEVLKSFSYDYEMFCHIKDKLLFARDFGLTYDYCYKCEGNNHLVFQCPKMHYCVDKKELIFREQKAEQSRDPKFDRVSEKWQGFFRKKQFIEEGFLQLIDEKEDLIEEFEDQYLYGNMYEVHEEDLESEFEKQQTNNMTQNQSVKNQLTQPSSQTQQSTQNSQLSAIDKTQSNLSNAVQISRTGSRELTRRVRARRLTAKEEAIDINNAFMGNAQRRKKSSKISTTIVTPQSQQQAFITQFQQQILSHLQKQEQQKSMTSMNIIEEEVIVPIVKKKSLGNQKNDNIHINLKNESNKDLRRTSIIQTPSEKSINSHKNKQMQSTLPPIPSSNLIIHNLNNIISLLQQPTQSNAQTPLSSNNPYHVNFRASNNENQQIPMSNLFNVYQDDNAYLKRESLIRGNTTNTHNNNNNNNNNNNTHYSKSNKVFNYNMELDIMKIMKQYMIDSNYPAVIDSMNRLFINEVRKKRKSSFKSRLKSNISQHRIDIFLKHQEFKKSQSQKNIIKVGMFSKKGSLEDEFENLHHQEVQRSMSLDYVQDDKASRISRNSQISKMDFSPNNFLNSNVLSVNNTTTFMQNQLNSNKLQVNEVSKINESNRHSWNQPDSSEEGTIMNVSTLYPNKTLFQQN